MYLLPKMSSYSFNQHLMDFIIFCKNLNDFFPPFFHFSEHFHTSAFLLLWAVLVPSQYSCVCRGWVLVMEKQSEVCLKAPVRDDYVC